MKMPEIAADAQQQFTEEERKVIYRVIGARRDMRHFLPGKVIEETVLQRLLEAAHCAPSVGLMQPWRFIRVRDTGLRASIAALVDEERQLTAQALAEREAEFLRLKVEGLRECAELLAVVLAPDDGTLFGRRTMPQQMALCSVACAVENLWLAARAENLGMGWVSLFDPGRLGQLLGCPSEAQPIALLCLGPVSEFYARPMLEQVNWRQGKPLHEMLMLDGWGGKSTC
jgi:5,6-dimethylbenzimidazole synthase